MFKKAGKANKAHARTDSSPPVNNMGPATPTDEAYDVSGLEAEVLKAIEKLTHELSQLRSGGKMNPDIVESLKVQLGTAGHGKETVRLGDIAQVVPRGRVLNVICGEDSVRSAPPFTYIPSNCVAEDRSISLTNFPLPSTSNQYPPQSPHRNTPSLR